MENRMRSGRGTAALPHARGFTYVALLVAVAVMSLAAAGAAEIWSQARQRDRERELLWIGNQFREAIALYYHRTPGSMKRYPEKLEDLLEDRRYPMVQRYLRRLYIDPMTGKAEWGLVFTSAGQIVGVHSLSERRPIKVAGFDRENQAFENSQRYADWRFVYEPPMLQQPSLAAAPSPSQSFTSRR